MCAVRACVSYLCIIYLFIYYFILFYLFIYFNCNVGNLCKINVIIVRQEIEINSD